MMCWTNWGKSLGDGDGGEGVGAGQWLALCGCVYVCSGKSHRTQSYYQLANRVRRRPILDAKSPKALEIAKAPPTRPFLIKPPDY